MSSLFDGVKGLLTDVVIDKVGDMIGADRQTTNSAIGSFLPTILGGLINKGSDRRGAEGLFDLIQKDGYGSSPLDLPGILGNSDKSSSWLKTGGSLLSMLFGNRQSGIIDLLMNLTGLKKSGTSSLLSFLAPLVLNYIGKKVIGGKLNASGLMDLLRGERSNVMRLMPAGMDEAMGLAAASSSSSTSRVERESNSGGGGGWWKWLLPLLLLLLLLVVVP